MGFSFTSFVFEIVNFVVLVWVLSRLVYRPLKKSLEERRAEQERRARAAEARSEEVERELETVRRREDELKELRERVMREAVEAAAEERTRLVSEAREDAAADRARGEKILESERQAARTWVSELAIEKSTEIAARLLAELAPRAVDEALLERLVEAVRVDAVDLLGGASETPPRIELRFARQPGAEEIDRLREVLGDALGAQPELVVGEDHALVAGVVAKIGHRVLDASIAGNLTLLAGRARELAAEMAADG